MASTFPRRIDDYRARRMMSDEEREQRLIGSELYAELRPLAFSIAYRMLGSVGEAEDVVQEAFLRLHQALTRETRIESPRSYLSTITTRIAIDHLRRARAPREEYVGEWLPEPLLEDLRPGVAEHAETADSLSLAFLVLLETLSPVQRAVFLLHDVFDYEYGEIAESAETRRRGKLSKQGSPELRWALVEAAHHACQGRSPDHSLYLAGKQRSGSKRAALTVARKIARRAYHVLNELEQSA